MLFWSYPLAAKIKCRGGIDFCHGWGGGSQYDDLLDTLADNGFCPALSAARLRQFHRPKRSGSVGRRYDGMRFGFWKPPPKIWAAGLSTGEPCLDRHPDAACFEGAVSLRLFAAWSVSARQCGGELQTNRASARFRKRPSGCRCVHPTRA